MSARRCVVGGIGVAKPRLAFRGERAHAFLSRDVDDVLEADHRHVAALREAVPS
jgi:hypothetical protein